MDLLIGPLCFALFAYLLVIFATILLSWFPVEPGSGLERLNLTLRRLTEPVLGPLRRALPPVRLGGLALDLSPIIVIIGLNVLRAIICR